MRSLCIHCGAFEQAQLPGAPGLWEVHELRISLTQLRDVALRLRHLLASHRQIPRQHQFVRKYLRTLVLSASQKQVQFAD